MRAALIFFLLLSANNLFAQSEPAQPIETSHQFGPYEVLYSIFPSTMLTEQVAASYNIVRGEDRAVLNISVRKHQSDGSDTEQSAKVTGSYTDLIQKKTLEFREIKEQ